MLLQSCISIFVSHGLLCVFLLRLTKIVCWFTTCEIHTSKFLDEPLGRVEPSKCTGLILRCAKLLPPLNWGIVVTLGVNLNGFKMLDI